MQRGVDVKVLTAMPNYPHMRIMEGYRGKCRKSEVIDGIPVIRSWIYTKTSKSIFHRLLNYFSFVFTSFFAGWFRAGRVDYIFCESPPLFLGISAFLLSKLKRADMIFNVSDLWPESAEKLGLIRSRFLLGISTRLEELLYKKSVLITGQTRGIVNNIVGRFPAKAVSWLPNGAELSYYSPEKYSGNWRIDNGFKQEDFLVFYGGILGHAQGLEVILKAAVRLKDHQDIKFVIMGDGPLKDELTQMRKENDLESVYFYETVPKTDMPDVLASINLSVIPLKKLELFRGAIPSKIFESLAMKKPILLGVEGEAKALFIDEGNCGLSFEPEDDADLAEKVMISYQDKQLMNVLGDNARAYAEQKFDRNKIADNFFNELNSMQD